VQRIPDGLTGASRPTALLVGPFDGKVWRAEVSWDGDGAFLGAGGRSSPPRDGSWRPAPRGGSGGGRMKFEVWRRQNCDRVVSRPLRRPRPVPARVCRELGVAPPLGTPARWPPRAQAAAGAGTGTGRQGRTGGGRR